LSLEPWNFPNTCKLERKSECSSIINITRSVLEIQFQGSFSMAHINLNISILLLFVIIVLILSVILIQRILDIFWVHIVKIIVVDSTRVSSSLRDRHYDLTSDIFFVNRFSR